MTLPVAILAGGLATRLHPITERIPKALVDVNGRPFAERQIALLKAHGLTDIVFLVGHLGETVRDALGDGRRWGVRLRYVFDGPQRLGTGGALRQAVPQLGEAFFVLYGDSYLECDYQDIAQEFERSSLPALMTVCRNDDRWDRSNVRLEGRRIETYDKSGASPQMRHIDYGLGVFHASVFGRYPPDAPFDLAEVYARLVAECRLAAYEVPGRFYEIGSQAGLEETRAHLATRPAVFLDRDGVINSAAVRDGKPYPPVSEMALEVLPGVADALARLRAAGLRTVVVTNQPDLARGAQRRDVVHRMHARLLAELALDEVRVCPHDDADACACRKPRPGLLYDAAREHGIPLACSYMVGDRWRDIEAGRRAGCTTVFIDHGYVERRPDAPDMIAGSLAQAAEWILSRVAAAR